ncbi:hypothetical protein ACQPZX_17200 [Actinoplanes sp. CA-142083]|uniref:hypothetical protein n=1 Tax=Actinoplanes sp. CA-142083 TaxID=3239903 RepID=UPI003D905706
MAEQPLTEAESAFLRHAEFGELPPRVKPDEYVVLVESDSRAGRPEAAISESQKDALYPGG